MRTIIQKRADVPRWQSIAAPLASVVLALLLGALIIAASGKDPVMMYATMARSALTTRFGLSETIVKAIPLMLCGFAVALTLKMKVLNLGAEGQLLMGAFAAAWLATTQPDLPAGILLPGMFLLSILAGGLWSVIAVVPRLIWGTSELITTLMLNYLAALWVSYLVNGPWKDPAARGFPLSFVFPAAAQLPTLGTTRVHLGLVFALLLAVGLYLFIKRTRWGYEMEVIGSSSRTARYAGMNIRRSILMVTMMSGAFAGLAGMSEVSGVIHRLQEGISPGYGFSAIIIAALAHYDALAVVAVSFLFGALLVGGFTLQTVGISANIVQILQGAVLVFVLASDFLLNYRVHFVGSPAILSAIGSRLKRRRGGPASAGPVLGKGEGLQ